MRGREAMRQVGIESAGGIVAIGALHRPFVHAMLERMENCARTVVWQV